MDRPTRPGGPDSGPRRGDRRDQGDGRRRNRDNGRGRGDGRRRDQGGNNESADIDKLAAAVDKLAKVVAKQEKAKKTDGEQKEGGKKKKGGGKGKGGKKKMYRLTEKRDWKKEEQPEGKEYPRAWHAEKTSEKWMRRAASITTPVSALAYIGYKAVGTGVEGAMTTSDRFLSWIAELGEEQIDKSIPGMKWLNKMIGKVEKKLGLDDLLADVLEKDREARQKLLDKLLKEERDAIKKHTKEVKAKKKKAKEKEEELKDLESKFGPETARILRRARDNGEASEEEQEEEEESEEQEDDAQQAA